MFITAAEHGVQSHPSPQIRTWWAYTVAYRVGVVVEVLLRKQAVLLTGRGRDGEFLYMGPVWLQGIICPKRKKVESWCMYIQEVFFISISNCFVCSISKFALCVCFLYLKYNTNHIHRHMWFSFNQKFLFVDPRHENVQHILIPWQLLQIRDEVKKCPSVLIQHLRGTLYLPRTGSTSFPDQRQDRMWAIWSPRACFSSATGCRASARRL